MRDIDEIIDALTRAHADIVVQQLQVLHPGADDDGVWFFRHPASPHEVQLESPAGACPFLFESDAHPSPATANTVAEGISLVAGGLGLAVPRA